MYNEQEKKDESCVEVNVFVKCDDKKDWEECNWEKKDKDFKCVKVNVFAECMKKNEKCD